MTGSPQESRAAWEDRQTDMLAALLDAMSDGAAPPGSERAA